MYGILLAIIIFFAGNCGGIEDGWKGIKPLQSDKASVEKLLGNADVNEDGYHSYRTDDTYIRVSYTSARCKKLEIFPDRGQFDVEPGTVLYYSVRLKKPLTLSELDLDREKYKLETDEDSIGLSYLINEVDGITITMSKKGDADYVKQLDFEPSKEARLEHSCSELAN